MRKVVISGSIQLQDKINLWKIHFQEKGYKMLDYPRPVKEEDFPEKLKDFYKNIEKTDIFFLMNEKKNGIDGYIGASAIAELTYAVIQNLIHNKKIEIYILNMPSTEVSAYDEVKFWLDMGWIQLYKEEK